MINAKKLRGKMVEKGFTQEKLAEAIGVSLNTLSRKINGKKKFTVEEAVRICTELDARSSVIEIFLPELSQIRNESNRPA